MRVCINGVIYDSFADNAPMISIELTTDEKRIIGTMPKGHHIYSMGPSGPDDEDRLRANGKVLRESSRLTAYANGNKNAGKLTRDIVEEAE